MTAAETPDPPAALATRARGSAPTAGELPGAARDPGSYRDPAGFVYRRSGIVYRQIQASFADDWEHFSGAGLYDRLRDEGLILPHAEVDADLAAEPPAFRDPPPDGAAQTKWTWMLTLGWPVVLVALSLGAMVLFRNYRRPPAAPALRRPERDRHADEEEREESKPKAEPTDDKAETGKEVKP